MLCKINGSKCRIRTSDAVDVEGGVRELEVVEAVVMGIRECRARRIHSEGRRLWAVEVLEVVLVDMRSH